MIQGSEQLVFRTWAGRMSKAFDVICIGSGLSGLAFAASRLMKYPETRLLMLEKHSIVGGYATQFVRPRHHARFEVSMHKLSGMGTNGNLRQLLSRLGILDKLEWIFPETLFDARHSHSNIEFPKDGNTVAQILQQRFPSCAQGIRTIFEDIRSHGYDGYMKFHILSGSYEVDLKRIRYANTYLKTQTVWNAISMRISDPHLRELLCLPCGYVGAFPEQMSYLYFLHVWYAVLFGESAYVRGGSNALTSALVQRIQELGGRIETKNEAVQVLINNDLCAYGVKTNTDTFFANEIVVNAAPSYVLDRLIDSALPGLDDVRATFTATPTANSTTSLYLVINGPPEQFGLMSEESMLVAQNPIEAMAYREIARHFSINAAKCEQAYWFESSIQVTNYHKLDPECGCVVVVSALDMIHHWPQRKTDAYRSKKSRAKEALMTRLFNAYPALRGHVQYAEVSTPITCLRYTGNPDGSGFGALVEPASGKKKQWQFPIQGVRFVGHWVSGSGYEATIGYGTMLGSQDL